MFIVRSLLRLVAILVALVAGPAAVADTLHPRRQSRRSAGHQVSDLPCPASRTPPDLAPAPLASPALRLSLSR